MTIAQQLNIKEFPFEIRDSHGNCIYWENSNGYWTKTKYNNNGKIIHYETSTGYWEKREYDAQCNTTRYETSSGYWEKSEYDAEGNCIYSENSDGYWAKWEYDARGNLIYYENSDGVITDHRPKTLELTDEEKEQLEDNLINTVIGEIKKDIEVGDVSAIWEMLGHCPTEQLIQYLPEEKWKDFQQLRAD